jgi:putative ABC transport system permease protein
VYDVRTMEDVIANSTAAFQRRYPALLIGIFAAVALVMASIGTYGVVAFSVEQRRQEIGIRLALGAQRGDIFRLVVGQGMAMAAVGVAVGAVGAVLATRGLEKLLFGVTATDPWTFAMTAGVLLGSAFAASCVPGVRASRVAPGVSLGE